MLRAGHAVGSEDLFNLLTNGQIINNQRAIWMGELVYGSRRGYSSFVFLGEGLRRRETSRGGGFGGWGMNREGGWPSVGGMPRGVGHLADVPRATGSPAGGGGRAGCGGGGKKRWCAAGCVLGKGGDGELRGRPTGGWGGGGGGGERWEGGEGRKKSGREEMAWQERAVLSGWKRSGFEC